MSKDLLEQAMSRSDGRCEASAYRAECLGVASTVHWINDDCGNDPVMFSNLLAVCEPCHDVMHSDRSWWMREDS